MENSGDEKKISVVEQKAVRCHECAMYKSDGSTGVFVAFRPLKGATVSIEYIVWFDSEQCRRVWLARYAGEVKLIG